MRIIFTGPARRDLDEAYDFIALDNPQAAERLLNRVNATVQQLADGDLTGPQVRLKSSQRARRWSVPPYRIYYRRSRWQTVIVRVYHQSRRSIEA
jgi:toxin ParE1/3/4